MENPLHIEVSSWKNHHWILPRRHLVLLSILILCRTALTLPTEDPTRPKVTINSRLRWPENCPSTWKASMWFYHWVWITFPEVCGPTWLGWNRRNWQTSDARHRWICCIPSLIQISYFDGFPPRSTIKTSCPYSNMLLHTYLYIYIYTCNEWTYTYICIYIYRYTNT